MSPSDTLIDLDHNATTRPSPAVIEAVTRTMRDAYANPGSRHAAGRRARNALESARETIARILDAEPEEVIFTSGGTEASNLALFGFASGPKGMLALPPAEHPATEETVRVLQSRGWQRVVLPVDTEGRLVQEALPALPWNEVRLATCLLAHNETGVIQDVQPLAKLCAEHRIPLHIDAVQAVGKIPVSFSQLNATTLAVGAHKFHGPRGIGALLLRKGARIVPRQYGGHQEQGHRPGTETVALAVGMATALEEWNREYDVRTERIRQLRDRLEAGLTEQCGPVVINGSREHRLPNTLNIAFPGCDGEAMLVALDLANVCCSMGSACASGSSEPAPVLVAMQKPPEVYKASLRFSVGIDNTLEEIDEAIRRVAEVVRRQRQAT
ncbi:Cysteine desulfurase [Maioricimonas rarisocia]|uniref:Cysteine desulfurase n=1 Tax=Maioricimonas rarisocia TaxID=2528026 RepID=A0A517Z890_9PLAN|nr:cysteine desulfurase family protein [Maioricimonas rarisocia]QDU38694.1 Cysteine desulfurase [Maioricimonas rarisocia]